MKKERKDKRNLNIENRTVGLRNKLGILAIVFLLIFAGVTGVVNANIKLKDPSGSDFGYWGDGSIITNSNGKSWTATGANLQAAIWDLNFTGGAVWLPTGNITITNTIEICADGITIIGASLEQPEAEGGSPVEEGTILYGNADLPEGIIKTMGVTAGWTFVDNLEIRDLKIKGNRDYHIVGVNLTCSSAGELRNMEFDSLNGEAIWGNNTHGYSFYECSFRNCGNTTNSRPAVWFTSSTTSVTNPTFISCTFEPCYYAWIEVKKQPPSGKNSGSYDGKISFCYFEGNGTHPKYGIIPGVGYLISNNNFRGGVTDYYIYMHEGYIAETQINNNHFESIENTTDYAIKISGTSRRHMINNNIFLGCNGGIKIDSGYNITVSDNCIRGRNTNNDTMGISITGSTSRFITIQDNTVYNFDYDSDWIGSGIRVDAGSNILVKNNYVYLCEIGIRIVGNNNTASNNHLWGIGRSDWSFKNDGTDNIIYDNYGTTGYAEEATNTFIFPTLITNSNGKSWAATGANIQLAIDDLGTDGGWVQLALAHYVITDTIYINKSGIELYMNMWHSNTTDPALGYGIFLDDNSDCDMLYIAGRKCHIHNLYLYGNSANQASGSGIKTAIDDYLDLHLSHIYLFYCKEYGFELLGGAGVFDAVYVEYSSDSGFYLGDFAYRNAFVNCGSYANLNGYEITKRENRFTNCVSADSTEYGFWLGVYAYSNIITSCFSQRDGHHAFYLYGAERNVIDGNMIYACSNDHDDTYSGIYLDTSGGQYANYNIITNNKIWSDTANEPKYGIAEEASTDDYNIITGNSVENFITSAILVNGANSIVKDNLGYNNNSLFPFYEQNTAPTIADNCTAYWYDTDDDYMYQITNSYGTVWYINMTTTI